MVGNKAVQFGALVDQLSTKKDGSIKVVIETQELPPHEVGELLRFRQQLVYVTLTEAPESNISIPDEPVEKGRKTQAQRLRSVIYLLWQAQGGKGDSEDFYRRTMERLIEMYKEKLD